MGDGKMGKRPPMVFYKTKEEYVEHYKRVYCRERIYTFDGIRVMFDPHRFLHAFYEDDKSSKLKKTKFSLLRARYIDWIKYTLESSESLLYRGYDKNSGVLPERRVAIVNEDKYVVIINMFFNQRHELCARFNTAFYADTQSVNKIKQSPIWDKEECENYLDNKKRS